MSVLRNSDVTRLFRRLAERMSNARDELCRLDGVIGDADHGIAMSQGFAAAAAALEALGQGALLSEQFNAAAKGFLNAVGASSGPLYATALMRAAKICGQRTELPLDEAPLLIVAMADGIRFRGKAEPGEKTMVDTWSPAAAAIEQGRAEGLPFSEVLAAMLSAANAGAESTKSMVAGKGRSARLGERSLGHIDPGAASALMIIEMIGEDWHCLAS